MGVGLAAFYRCLVVGCIQKEGSDDSGRHVSENARVQGNGKYLGLVVLRRQKPQNVSNVT